MKVLPLLVVALLAGCASVAKVETGKRTVGERLVLTLDGAWNHVNAPGLGPAQVWTMEGMPIDRMLIFSGVKDGEPVHESRGATPRRFVFQARMQPDEIVSMFEGAIMSEGSSFKLLKMEPTIFGTKGFRFEYATTRQYDHVQLLGVGYATVDKGELFALLYFAPRIEFYPRYRPRVDGIAQSAKLKN
jgi:hypothetical protein